MKLTDGNLFNTRSVWWCIQSVTLLQTDHLSNNIFIAFQNSLDCLNSFSKSELYPVNLCQAMNYTIVRVWYYTSSQAWQSHLNHDYALRSTSDAFSLSRPSRIDWPIFIGHFNNASVCRKTNTPTAAHRAFPGFLDFFRTNYEMNVTVFLEINFRPIIKLFSQMWSRVSM